MNPQGDGGFAQGRASDRPLLCGNNFTHYWRSLMQMYIIDPDLEIWNIIKTGPRKPMTEIDWVRVPKCENDYIQCDLELIAKN